MLEEAVLSGLRVLDVTHYVAGPYCTKLLADFGAEVIKVEKPGQGDGARVLGPFPGDETHPEKSALFLYLNTNKQSITLNLKNPTGVKIFKELVRETDIIVENFKPGGMSSLGLSYEALKEVNPDIIMVSISNFGQSGPYRDWKAYSATLSAVGGASYITGKPESPIRLPGYLPEYMAGQQGFMSCLLAILGGDNGDRGQHIDLSIAETVATGLEAATILYAYTGIVRQRNFVRFMVGHPVGIFPCRDGHVVVIPGLGNMPLLAILIEQPELAEHPLFLHPYKRQEAPEEFDALILPWLMEHDKEDVFAQAQELKMPFGVVRNIDEVVADPHLKEREYFVEIDHPATGRHIYPRLPFREATKGAEMKRAPLLGEHNDEIYGRRLGYTEEQLAKLREEGVI